MPYSLIQKEPAGHVGVSYPCANEPVPGKRGVTPDTALRLARLFGGFWLNLQQAYDLYQVRQRAKHEDIKPLRLTAPNL